MKQPIHGWQRFLKTHFTTYFRNYTTACYFVLGDEFFPRLHWSPESKFYTRMSSPFIMLSENLHFYSAKSDKMAE